MDKFTVSGFAVIGVGSYVATIDKLKVWGFVLIGAGSLIVAYRQRRDSRADSAMLEEKIGEIRREIASAREVASSPEETKKLDNIGQEFRQWAADFVRNKERNQLEVEQIRVGAVESQLKISELWRPVLEFCLETVRRSVQAYAAETSTAVLVQLPPLPMNLYDKKISYQGTVVFNPKVKWKIQLDRASGAKMVEFPVLWIKLDRGGEDTTLAHIWSYNREDQFVNLSLHSDALPRLSGIEGAFAFKNWPVGFRSATRRLVEAQLLSL